MQPIRIQIDVNPHDIPTLVCSVSSDASSCAGYNAAIARAVADALGVQDYLFRPDRIHELRRLLWEKDQAAAQVPGLAVR